MDGSDFFDLAKYLIDAVSTSHWAEVLLLIVVLVTLLGGGFLVYKRMGSTERLILRLLDMLHPGSKAPPPEDKDASES